MGEHPNRAGGVRWNAFLAGHPELCERSAFSDDDLLEVVRCALEILPRVESESGWVVSSATVAAVLWPGRATLADKGDAILVGRRLARLAAVGCVGRHDRRGAAFWTLPGAGRRRRRS
jgi:hypothetical protein